MTTPSFGRAVKPLPEPATLSPGLTQIEEPSVIGSLRSDTPASVKPVFSLGYNTPMIRPLPTTLTALLLTLPSPGAQGDDPAPPWVVGRLVPTWADARPRRTIEIAHDASRSDEANGERLARALADLKPGDRLEIGPGRYSIARKMDLTLRGSAEAPIWIAGADPDRKPVITRPDARQNVLNVGERSRAEFICFRGLELTGGSTLIRFHDCRDIWLDRCHLHHAGHEGITTNTRDTTRFFITDNHFHHFTRPGATGEAMYLGANHGKAVMSYSVIAGNHVHDCGGSQGDGIELKQGSHHNWIVGNHVHDTNYPCILAYGTGGRGLNVIERNVCYRSGDNVIQVQGEAIVRNNLIVAADGAGFASTDHQGKTRALTVVHNTIISRRRGANLSSWNGREGMVFANNLVVVESGDAIRFPRGAAGVVVAGNVVTGGVSGIDTGFVRGGGLADLEDVTRDAARRNATPRPGSAPIGAAEPRFEVEHDLTGARRGDGRVAGAYDVAAGERWIWSTAHRVPRHTTSEESGYFALVAGLDGTLYIGTAKYGDNAYLVAFDPQTGAMRVVVDCEKEIGVDRKGFAAQSKIHTRNNVGRSGKIYFGTKQGYPREGETRDLYPGGHPMVHDPRSGKTRVHDIPVPRHGIISVTPDESRGLAYISTCNDARPIESTHFLVLDLERGTYRDLMDCRHMYAFIVLDHRGRAYHPVLGGGIARYDPDADRLEVLSQTIDGRPPSTESLLAHPESHPINWEVSPDRRTLWAVAMSGNALYAYDLDDRDERGDARKADGVLRGRRVASLLEGAASTDCRALCVAPDGTVWAGIAATFPGGEQRLRLVSYRPGDSATRDHGAIAISNPDYASPTGPDGKPLSHQHGVHRAGPRGALVPRYVVMAICAPGKGRVYLTTIYPFTLHEIDVGDR